MRNRSLSAILLMLALLAPAMTIAQKKPGRTANGSPTAAPLPPVKVTEFKLKNGLRVILHEDHSTPIVGVNLWYHVGSKNEVPGKTGFAHLFEHMMFQGSKNYDDDYFKPIQEAGGTLNGSTNPDRTNYFEVVPSNFLELALFMEADRMGGLLDVINETKLANQRDVVKNEKRQNYDNRPYGLIGAKINETLYPARSSLSLAHDWFARRPDCSIDGRRQRLFPSLLHSAQRESCDLPVISIRLRRAVWWRSISARSRVVRR